MEPAGHLTYSPWWRDGNCEGNPHWDGSQRITTNCTKYHPPQLARTARTAALPIRKPRTTTCDMCWVHYHSNLRKSATWAWHVQDFAQGTEAAGEIDVAWKMQKGSRLRREPNDHYWLHWITFTATDEKARIQPSPISSPRTTTTCNWLQTGREQHMASALALRAKWALDRARICTWNREHGCHDSEMKMHQGSRPIWEPKDHYRLH